MPKDRLPNPLFLVAVYVLFGSGWILLGDFITFGTERSAETYAFLEKYKGIAFVVLSGLLLWFLLRQYNRRLRHFILYSERSEKLYEQLFQQSHMPVWIFALHSHELLRMNEAARRLFELPAALPEPDLSFDTFIDPHDRALLQTHFTEDASGGSLGIWRFRTRTDKLLHLSFNLQATQFQGEPALLAMANDVSAMVQAEEERQQLHNELLNYKKALDRSAMLSVANLQGDILDINDKFCEITQYQREELLGKNHNILDSHYRSADYFRRMYKALQRGDIWRDEFRNRAKDGRIFWVDMSIIPVFDSNNNACRYMAIAYPITSRKRAERQSEVLHEEFATFMYKTSHKLRGPVATLSGLVELACMEVRDQTACHYLKLLNERIRHLDFTLDEIIAITKIKQESLQIETIDFEALLQEVIVELKPLIDAHQIRVFQETQVLQSFHTDRRLLRALLFYLLDNACRFRNNLQSSVWVKVWSEDQGIKLSVRDNGPGIASAIRARIFEMYFRGNEQSQGSGLGLYIVKAIVERLEGYIQVHTSQDHGSEFQIYLPDETYRAQLVKEREYLYLQNEQER